MLRGAV